MDYLSLLLHDLIVHIHTSPGAASDIDRVGQLVDRYGEAAKVHLVHFGGGMSGHIKLVGGRFFGWIENQAVTGPAHRAVAPQHKADNLVRDDQGRLGPLTTVRFSATRARAAASA